MTEFIERGRFLYRRDLMAAVLILLFFSGGVAGSIAFAAGLPGGPYAAGNAEVQAYWKLLIPELASVLMLFAFSLIGAGIVLIPAFCFFRGFRLASVITGLFAVLGPGKAGWIFLAECPRLLLFLLPVISFALAGCENALRIVRGRPAVTGEKLYLLWNAPHLGHAAGMLLLIAGEAAFRYKLFSSLLS